MKDKIKSIRGMNDILPPESALWQQIEYAFAHILQSYGYGEIRTPLVESTALFKRSIGEVTDIVEKEMYTFDDRNGDSLTLRPEGTASIVRSLIQHGLTQRRQKFWYKGPMFRHERPQKGRYRQFHQLGCEAFGLVGPDIDAEMIAIGARLWQRLGLKDITLEINSLGSSAARNDYRQVLLKYFNKNKKLLDEDSLRRLDSNPLRILDSKNPSMQHMINLAPRMIDHLDEESQEHFATLCQFLDELDIKYTINQRLVRGLDYYSKTVFEWTTTQLGAQGTICAGGRYDGMVEHLGGKQPVPAVGFALGVERLLALIMQDEKNLPHRGVDIFFISANDEALSVSMQLAETLRDKFSGLVIINSAGGGKFKAQFKRADQAQAHYAFVIGKEELDHNTVSIKNMISQEQQTIKQDELEKWVLARR